MGVILKLFRMTPPKKWSPTGTRGTQPGPVGGAFLKGLSFSRLDFPVFAVLAKKNMFFTFSKSGVPDKNEFFHFFEDVPRVLLSFDKKNGQNARDV